MELDRLKICFVVSANIYVLLSGIWKVAIVTGAYERDDVENQDVGDDWNADNNANSQIMDSGQRSKKYKIPPTAPSSQLIIVMYGEKGKTELLPLTCEKPFTADLFQPGERVDFKVGAKLNHD